MNSCKHDNYLKFSEIALTGSSNSVSKIQEDIYLSEFLDLKEPTRKSFLGIIADTQMNLKQMKRIITSSILTIITISVFSQSAIDSLERDLENATSDTAKIMSMLKLADIYLYDNENKSYEYFNKAKVLLDKKPFKKGYAYYYFINGFLIKNSPSEKLENYNKSLQLYTELKDKLGIAIVNFNMGRFYVTNFKSNTGMLYYIAAYKIYQSLNDIEGMTFCYISIGNIYNNQNQFNKALDYYKEALSLYPEKNYEYYGVYVRIANNYAAMGDEKTALHYYDSLVDPLKQRNYLDLLTTVYNSMGDIYENLKSYGKAKKYYKLSFDIVKKAEGKYYDFNSCLSMAKLFVSMNQPDSAIILLEKNLQPNLTLNEKNNYYSILSSAYEKKDDIRSSYKYYKLFKIVSDSIKSDKSNQRLYELQTSLEVDRKDEEIELLNKENLFKSQQLTKQKTIIILSLLTTLLFLITAFVLYNRFRLKRNLVNLLEKKNSEIEKQQEEIVFMLDILEKQNEDLLELDSIKSRFFTNISHEFRTPLSLIIAPLTTMQEKYKDDETKNEIRLMLKHAYSLLNLINQLLELSKLQKASLKLQLSHGDVNALMLTVIDLFSLRATELSIRLTYQSNFSPFYCWYDQDKLGKIMVNIISNAMKHTQKGGLVEISLTKPNDNPNYSEIVVSDSGIGIEAHELKTIFEPFYQSSATLDRKIEGIGVGLALVKELVELHGGTILAHSEKGKGAQFTIRIAVNKELLPSAEILKDEVEGLFPFSEIYQPYFNDLGKDTEYKLIKDKTTILVVEDNDDMRRYISKSLLTYYQVIEASNGQEGYDKAVKTSPDLIITDVMMPQMNGYEMTKQLKKDPRTSHIPVIMLTAKASEESKIDGLEVAADDYIVKPFNIKELLLRIRNAITNRKLLRDKFQKCITVNPSEVTATSIDEQFLTKALQIIENHLSESEFSVDDFCSEIGISKTNVYRKLKALTDQSFTEFMRCIRLKRAASLLQQKSGNLTEIAYKTGFTNLSYFSRSFKEQFGVNPSEYVLKTNCPIEK